MFERGNYVLIPIEERTAKLFLPVDIAEKRIRLAMNTDDAWRLIKEITAVYIMKIVKNITKRNE